MKLDHKINICIDYVALETNCLLFGKPYFVMIPEEQWHPSDRQRRFLICDWPWLNYRGKQIDCCSVDQCWALIVQHRSCMCRVSVWASSGHAAIFLKIQSFPSYLKRLSIHAGYFIKIVSALLGKIAIVCSNLCKGPLFLERERSTHGQLTYDW
jgi:hypothetical protein